MSTYTVVVRIKIIGATSQQEATAIAEKCFTRGELPVNVDSMRIDVESLEPAWPDQPFS